MLTLGIDPGIDGAFAWVTPAGYLVAIEDMPTIEVRGKHRIVAAQVAALMLKRPLAAVVIEAVVAMPRRAADGSIVANMGAASSLASGYGAGILEGVAAGIGLPVSIWQPATWKSRAKAPKDKNECRMRASRMWPGLASQFKRKKDDGRADAALLAYWAAINRIGQVDG